jgi:hypothetical protein
LPEDFSNRAHWYRNELWCDLKKKKARHSIRKQKRHFLSFNFLLPLETSVGLPQEVEVEYMALLPPDVDMSV